MADTPLNRQCYGMNSMRRQYLCPEVKPARIDVMSLPVAYRGPEPVMQ